MKMAKLFLFLGLLGLSSYISSTFGMAGGDIYTGFNIGSGFNNTVRYILKQSDGKILVGGQFTNYSGTAVNRIARLNTDGSLDNTFNIGNGFNNSIWGMALQPDGKILVGGDFTNYSGTAVNRIARLNTDGTIDTGFNVGGNGASNTVYTILVQSDGKIIFGGVATGYNNTPVSATYKVFRANADGTLDTSFNSVGYVTFNASIYNMILEPDGKVVAAGGFTISSGVAINRIVRLTTTGSRDTSFNVGGGFNNYVYWLGRQSDGHIIAGGYFTTYNGVTSTRIARLSSTGALDTAFGAGGGFNDYVLTLHVQPDDRVLVGGGFTTYRGVAANRIIRLNTDGTKDNDFIFGSGINSWVNHIITDGTGIILIGGIFSTYNNIPRNGLVSVYDWGVGSYLINDGYTRSGSNYIGSTGIDVSVIYSHLGVSYLKDVSVKMSSPSNSGYSVQLPTNTKFFSQGSDYTGNLNAPTIISSGSVSNPPANMKVLGGLRIGNGHRIDLITTGGQSLSATINIPVDSRLNGKMVRVYYSENSGANRNILTSTSVVNGVATFQTTHFTDFIVTYSELDGNVYLQILSGISDCQYGTSLNLGEQDVKLDATYDFTGAFSGEWFCADYKGYTGGWAFTIQTSDLTSSRGSLISGTNLRISHDPVSVSGDVACTGAIGSPAEFYSTGYAMFEKRPGSDRLCRSATSNVGLQITVPANQSPGNYTGTLTIYLPNFF